MYFGPDQSCFDRYVFVCSCEVTMGDLQSEEQRDILIELLLPALPNPTSDQVIGSQLVYFNVITSALDTVDCPLVLKRTGLYYWCSEFVYTELIIIMQYF